MEAAGAILVSSVHVGMTTMLSQEANHGTLFAFIRASFAIALPVAALWMP
jgi:hypothetical protein